MEIPKGNEMNTSAGVPRGLQELTLLQAVLVCNLLCIAAACDGFQISLNGELLAD